MSFSRCLLRSYSTLQRMTASKARLSIKQLTPETPIYGTFKNIVETPEIQYLAGVFSKAGYELRIAGGAVRDLISGSVPHDVDFATTATPTQMIDLLGQFKDTVRVITTRAGERHGTVTARINDKNQYEITTLRIDIVTDGRHAEVEFTQDWTLDASRRDLTINAMFLDLNGKLYDYFGGAQDLEENRVLFVGDAEARIQEDYLRILRYFRFYARYGHKSPHDPQTLQAIRENVHGLVNISGERVWSETKRILPLYYSKQVVPVIVKEIGILKYMGFLGCDSSETWSQRDLSAFDLVHSRLHSPELKDSGYEPITLLTSIITDDTELLSVCSRLKFSTVERETALYIIVNRNQGEKLTTRRLKQQLAMAPKSDQHQLRGFICEFLKYSGNALFLDEMKSWEIPVFPFRGDVIGKKVTNKRMIGTIMDELKLIWAQSDFDMSEQELLQEVDKVVAAVSEKVESGRSKSHKTKTKTQRKYSL